MTRSPWRSPRSGGISASSLAKLGPSQPLAPSRPLVTCCTDVEHPRESLGPFHAAEVLKEPRNPGPARLLHLPATTLGSPTPTCLCTGMGARPPRFQTGSRGKAHLPWAPTQKVHFAGSWGNPCDPLLPLPQLPSSFTPVPRGRNSCVMP